MKKKIVIYITGVILTLAAVSTCTDITRPVQADSVVSEQETITKLASIIQRDGSVAEPVAIKYAKTVAEASRIHGIEKSVILAVIYVESRFSAKAVNPGDGAGLMQIVGSIHKMPIKLLLDPYHNIRAGTKILAGYRAKSKNMSDALARYNGTYKVNDKYSKKVLRRAKLYKQEIFNMKGNDARS